MKMTKKILLGAAALVAALAFVGCGAGDGDDTEKAITGSGKKYTVSFTNETGDEYRAYKTTTLKHAGALVKVTFNNADKPATFGTSKMGVIFNLKEDGEKREFYLIGLNPDKENTNFYVSKYSNITDIKASNFGAKTNAAEGEPSEIEIVPLKKSSKISSIEPDADGNWSVYVFYKAINDGSFDFAILNITDEEAKKITKDDDYENLDYSAYLDKILESGNTLAKADAEEDFADTTGVKFNKNSQKKLAVYARIPKDKTLEGSWEIASTYKEADVIEE